MDIVVTIPKSEYENDNRETAIYLDNPEEYEQFWTLSKRPVRAEVGDRVYFVKHGEIESSMRITRIESGEAHCDVTDRNWKGESILYLDDYRKENGKIKVKGFQGFRYKWWE